MSRVTSLTDDLVDRFAVALKEKLNAAEEKHGWNNTWLNKGDLLRHNIIADMHVHITKGDPLDVAAYCAFLWHHGWKTEHPEVVAEWRKPQ